MAAASAESSAVSDPSLPPSSSSSSSSSTAADVLVDELYHFRDHFFETHPVSEAAKMEEHVVKAMRDCLAKLEPLVEADRSSAHLSYLKGKALNVTQQYSKEAEDCLSRAVKLDPAHTDAWNTLGECSYKKGDYEASKHCFLGALSQKKNKVSLRNLSVVLRQGLKGRGPLPAAVAESVERAREACALDVSDGKSWHILGNAHLYEYFSPAPAPRTHNGLALALKAYQRALLDPVQAKNSPDAHYSKALVLKYLEHYEDAQLGFRTALSLDPSNPLPSQQIQSIESHLDRVHDAIASKGRLKAKRIAALIQGLKMEAALGSLVQGMNKTPLDIAVVSALASTEAPQAYLCIDATATCFCLSVYNMAANALKTGDRILVPGSVVKVVAGGGSKGRVQYVCVAVEDPSTLIVNDTPLGVAKMASVNVVATATAE